MPFDFSNLRREFDGARSVDPEDVWVQFVCTTTGGGHDPDGEPDDRVRPSHAALHGTVWRIDDPAAPLPPINWGCRCRLRLVARPRSVASNVLPVAPDRPLSDPRPTIRAWLDGNIEGWEKVAKALRDVPAAEREAEGMEVAKRLRLGIDRETVRLIIQSL